MAEKEAAEKGTAEKGAAEKEAAEALVTKAIVGSLFLGLALTLLLLWGVGVREVISTFLHARWSYVLGYLVVSVAIALAVTYKWRLVLEAYGVKLPFFTLFIYRLIGFAVSYVTPVSHVGGEPVRALLVGKQGIPYKVSFSAVIVDRMLDFLFNIAIFFVGALIVANSTSFPLPARVSIFVLSLILVVGATLFLSRLLLKKKVLVPLLRFFQAHRLRSWQRIRQEANELELLIEYFYARKRSYFFHCLLVNALLWVLMFGEYKLALLILGYDASLFGVFLFLTGVGIAYTIPIPAALGVLELGQLTAGALLGVKASIGLALAFLIRMRDLVWTLFGLLLLGLFHLNFFNLAVRSREMAQTYDMGQLQLGSSR